MIQKGSSSSTLPFAFDTSDVVVIVLRGVAGVLGIVVVGILYLLVVWRLVAALGLLLVGALILYFGRLFVSNLTGSKGTITTDAVVVEPVRMCGVLLPGPAGAFRIHQFASVRVERVSAPVEAQGGPHTRISLVGKEGTPTILVGRMPSDAGRAFGRDLAAALTLPFEEHSAPY